MFVVLGNSQTETGFQTYFHLTKGENSVISSCMDHSVDIQMVPQNPPPSFNNDSYLWHLTT